MNCAVVPTKFGYSAVCLPPFDRKEWVLYSAIVISPEMLIQLRGQILHRLSEYCYQFMRWENQLPIAILWCIWSIVSLAICSLWDMGAQYIILYMWIRFLFFGDGIWTLGKTLAHFLGVCRVKRIRKTATKAEWKFVPGKMPYHCDIFMDREHSSEKKEATEREYIDWMMNKYPITIPYYQEMLRKQPPMVFDWWPLGILGLLKRFLTAPRVRLPILIFELGELQC